MPRINVGKIVDFFEVIGIKSKKYKYNLFSAVFLIRWMVRVIRRAKSLFLDIVSLRKQLTDQFVEFSRMQSEYKQAHLNGVKPSDKPISIVHSRLIKTIGELASKIENIFGRVAEVDFSTDALEFKQFKEIQELRKMVKKKIFSLRDREINALQKAMKKVTKNAKKEDGEKLKGQFTQQLNACKSKYNNLNIEVNEKISHLTNGLVSQIKIQWQDSKRQAKRWVEPITEVSHIATDQLIREVKVYAKQIWGRVKEEHRLLKELRKAKTIEQFRNNFNALTSFYHTDAEEIEHMMHRIKILFFRLILIIEALEKDIKNLPNLSHKDVEPKIIHLRHVTEEFLRVIEQQDQWLSHEVRKEAA